MIQDEIPGKPELSLPGTLEELKRIEKHIPEPRDDYLVKLGTKSKLQSSIAGVLCQLPVVSFAHFGCHGTQSFISPLDSGLVLSDGQLSISQLVKCQMPKASLAYLSACETAKGDLMKPDEALHIAASMLFAGFRGVVGTLWYALIITLGHQWLLMRVSTGRSTTMMLRE